MITQYIIQTQIANFLFVNSYPGNLPNKKSVKSQFNVGKIANCFTGYIFNNDFTIEPPIFPIIGKTTANTVFPKIQLTANANVPSNKYIGNLFIAIINVNAKILYVCNEFVLKL